MSVNSATKTRATIAARVSEYLKSIDDYSPSCPVSLRRMNFRESYLASKQIARTIESRAGFACGAACDRF